MPYIPDEERAIVRKEGVWTAGQLAFAVTRLIQQYCDRNGGLSWTNFSTACGSIWLAIGEFERRHVHPYENGKMAENGDVE